MNETYLGLRPILKIFFFLFGYSIFKLFPSEIMKKILLPIKLKWKSNKLKCIRGKNNNRATHFKKCQQLFEYQHLLFLRTIWWSKL